MSRDRLFWQVGEQERDRNSGRECRFLRGWVRGGAVLAFWAMLTVCIGVPAQAAGSQLIFGGSPEYVWGEADALQQGRTPGTNVFPLTLREYQATILHEDLPLAEPSTNKFVFSLQPYGATFDIPYGGVARTSNDVVYLQDRLPRILTIGDELSLGDWLDLRLVIDQVPGMRYMVGQSYFVPWQFRAVSELEFPREGYMSLSLPGASMAVGRLKTGIGHGHFGNTMLNGLAPYYDEVQFTAYNDHFKFFYMLGSSQTYLSEAEYAVQSSKKWDTLNDHDASPFDDPVKMFAYHRVEARPLDWFTLGITEMNIVGGKLPNFNHINPFGLWHNTYTAGCSNVMFGLDATVVPLKGLMLFGEFTVDDIKGLDEAANSKPKSTAWQVGGRYVLPFWTETKHIAGVEFTHVDPWTYNRWQPYLTMYQRYVQQGGWSGVDVPLGFTFGGDLNHYGLYYTVVDKKGMMAEINYQHLDKGPIDLGTILTTTDGSGKPVYVPVYYDAPGWENVSTLWDHGVVEKRDILAISLTYPLPYSLTLNLYGSYSWINNFNHVQDAKESLSLFSAGLKWSF